MNRKILAGVAIAVVGVVGVSAWLWSGNSSQKNDITLLGNVDIRQVSLAFQDSERIVEMRVEEGAKVTAGQVLAVLDTRTLELQAAQTEAQIEVNKKALLRLRNGSRPEEIGQVQARVDAATTDAKLAELDFQRMQSIAEETHGRGVSRQELDRAAATLKAARAKVEDQSMALRLAKLGPRSEDIEQAAAQLKASEESLALLRHRISLAELKAPTNAVVRSRLAEPGDMASPQKPVYALAIVQPKWIRAYVNEAQLARVRPGMSAEVKIDGLPDASIAGEVGYISSVAEFTPKPVQTEELRTSLVYEVRVLVKDPDDQLRLGMPATVRLVP